MAYFSGVYHYRIKWLNYISLFNSLTYFIDFGKFIIVERKNLPLWLDVGFIFIFLFALVLIVKK